MTNGVVGNLGIVRSVGAATSMSLEGLKQASAGAASVKIDAGDIARRALKNTATEVAPTLLKKGLSGLMRR